MSSYLLNPHLFSKNKKVCYMPLLSPRVRVFLPSQHLRGRPFCRIHCTDMYRVPAPCQTVRQSLEVDSGAKTRGPRCKMDLAV